MLWLIAIGGWLGLPFIGVDSWGGFFWATFISGVRHTGYNVFLLIARQLTGSTSMMGQFFRWLPLAAISTKKLEHIRTLVTGFWGNMKSLRKMQSFGQSLLAMKDVDKEIARELAKKIPDWLVPVMPEGQEWTANWRSVVKGIIVDSKNKMVQLKELGLPGLVMWLQMRWGNNHLPIAGLGEVGDARAARYLVDEVENDSDGRGLGLTAFEALIKLPWRGLNGKIVKWMTEDTDVMARFMEVEDNRVWMINRLGAIGSEKALGLVEREVKRESKRGGYEEVYAAARKALGTKARTVDKAKSKRIQTLVTNFWGNMKSLRKMQSFGQSLLEMEGVNDEIARELAKKIPDWLVPVMPEGQEWTANWRSVVKGIIVDSKNKMVQLKELGLPGLVMWLQMRWGNNHLPIAGLGEVGDARGAWYLVDEVEKDWNGRGLGLTAFEALIKLPWRGLNGKIVKWMTADTNVMARFMGDGNNRIWMINRLGKIGSKKALGLVEREVGRESERTGYEKVYGAARQVFVKAIMADRYISEETILRFLPLIDIAKTPASSPASIKIRQISPVFGKLLNRMNAEIIAQPDAERKTLETQFNEAFAAVRRHWINLKKDEMLNEYRIIDHMLTVVHDNLPLALNAVANLGFRPSEFGSLLEALPINNPLTRIIRMLGEDPELVGGYSDVTKRVIESGKWEQFNSLIDKLAQIYKRGAPEQVAGVLEVLRNERDLEKWSDADWKAFQKNVENYYKNVFEVLNATFYHVYVRIANNHNKVIGLRQALNRESAGLYSGSFWGFSQSFMKQYKLSVADELALMGRVMTIQNQSTRDFAGEAIKVKAALKKRGVKAWQSEVDPALRKRYVLGGTTMEVVYQGELNREDRRHLHQKLIGYARTFTPSDVIKAVRAQLQKPNETKRERLKGAAAGFVFAEQKIDPRPYAKPPVSEEETQKWLTAWQTFFMDTFKQDGYGKLVKLVEEAIAGLDQNSFATWLQTTHLQLLPLIKIQMKADNKVANLVGRTDLSNDEKAQKLAEILADWFSRVQGEDIRNAKKFKQWILSIALSFVQSVQGKLERESKPVPKDLEETVRKALLHSREKFLEVNGEKTDQARLAVMGAGKETAEIWRMFAAERDFIEKELKGFKETERSGSDQFEVGFYDDYLHLMGFMMSGVCTWQQRDSQVANTTYHFGKLVLKNAAERFAALSQVQILRTGISGMKPKESAKGWQVFALPGLNMDTGNAGVSRERGLQVLLEAAQRLAEAAGMQGAVVPTSAVIHAQRGPDQKVIAAFVSKGWLKKVSLTETVVLSTRDANQPGYSYSEVYLVQIPKDQWILNETTGQKKGKGSKSVGQKLKTKFGNGLGEMTFSVAPTAVRATQIDKAVNEIISEMPEEVISHIRNKASAKGVKLRIRIDADSDESIVQKLVKDINLTVGRDVLYAEDRIEDVKLADMLAEFLAAFILSDYAKLKEKSATDENAYFKLAVVKGLLNHSRYLALYHRVLNKFNWVPSHLLSEKSERDRKNYFSKYKADLKKFNRGVERINQWNLYLNIMDDADPDFMVINYLYLIEKTQATDIGSLISTVAKTDIVNRPSIAALRNVFKVFILKEKVRIKIGDDIVEKQTFDHFGGSQKLADWEKTLRTTQSQNSFYSAIRGVLNEMLPLSEDELNQEISRLIDNDLFSAPPSERVKAIRKTLKEILIRRIGGSAFESFKEHLTGARGFKNIPYLTMSTQDLEEGADADSYGFLEYSTKGKVDYELVFKSGEDSEESMEDAVDRNDWVHELFPLPRHRSDGPGAGSQWDIPPGGISALLKNTLRGQLAMTLSLVAGIGGLMVWSGINWIFVLIWVGPLGLLALLGHVELNSGRTDENKYNRHLAPLLENMLVFTLHMVLMSHGQSALEAGLWAWGLFVLVHAVEAGYFSVKWAQSRLTGKNTRAPPFNWTPLKNTGWAALIAGMSIAFFQFSSALSLSNLTYVISSTAFHLGVNNGKSRSEMRQGANWLANIGVALRNKDIAKLTEIKSLGIGNFGTATTDSEAALIAQLNDWGEDPGFRRYLTDALRGRLDPQFSSEDELNTFVDVLISVVLGKVGSAKQSRGADIGNNHLFLFRGKTAEGKNRSLRNIGIMMVLLQMGTKSSNKFVVDKDARRDIENVVDAMKTYGVDIGNTVIETDDALMRREKADLSYLEEKYGNPSLIVLPGQMKPDNAPPYVIAFEDIMAPIAGLNTSNITKILRMVLIAA